MALNWYGTAALAAILVVFYVVRRIPLYVAACAAIALAFAVLTALRPGWGISAEWVVMTVGLMACIFGLLIVRVMLIRSVSLRLLATIERGKPENIGEDIGSRLRDMRAAGLIQSAPGGVTLTGFGRLIGGAVALFYALFRIDR